ncbi:MAG: hypothetical protein JWM74_2780, partial [Myxococcaceae bacterium]|nr:hypothetical protein [Myxococcaceae bacterium]
MFDPERAHDERPVTFDAAVFVLRRNWRSPGIALAVAVAAIVYTRFDYALEPLAWFVAWMGIVFAAVSVARDAFPLATAAALHASPASLTIGNEAPIATETIAEAKTVPQPNGKALVVLALRDGRTRTLLLTNAQADTLVRVLGVGAGERRTTFSLVAPYRTRFLVTLLAIGVPWLLVLSQAGPGLRWLQHDMAAQLLAAIVFNILPLSALVAWFLSAIRGRVVIGADGFSVKWLGRERFFPYAQVSTVRSDSPWWNKQQHDTIVTLARKQKIRLRARDAPVTEAHRSAQARALHDHLVKARARAREQPVESDNVAALLGAGSRNGREWLAQLDALVHGGTSRYRVAAPGPDLLA